MNASPSREQHGTFSSQYLLSVRFDDVTLPRALAMLSEREVSSPFVYVVTPNADHWIRLQRQPELRPLYEPAWLSLCDSRILQLLARWRGVNLEIAPGSDLTQQLFDRVIKPDTPVTIIGATAEIVETIRARYGLRRLAHHNPPMGFIRDPAAVQACVDFILAHPAKFVLLCVGSPQQEKLAAALVASGRATGIGLCVGASAEFVAGAKRRAPLWIQKAHLEWLHRLVSEPRRLWKRYILEAPALLRLMMKVPRGGDRPLPRS
ncbi:glycosyltransferase, WecB/TagA/CpsF family [Acetobacteraceae bacterium AT-5844]|nr:glycosyltransferase, WecB/TagA/CpsF family [Acetobacteraceae bacterium AT-5844]